MEETLDQFKFYQKLHRLSNSKHGTNAAFTNTPTLTGEMTIIRWGTQAQMTACSSAAEFWSQSSNSVNIVPVSRAVTN